MRDTARNDPPRLGARTTALVGTLLCLLGVLGLARAADDHRILLRAPVGAGLEVEYRADSSLILRSAAAAEPALSAVIQITNARRRGGRQAEAFHVGRASEGCPAGQRGFSGGADDDGDGRFDEDPLDGRDNDGDGRVDEDYAAVGDLMLTTAGPTPTRKPPSSPGRAWRPKPRAPQSGAC